MPATPPPEIPPAVETVVVTGVRLPPSLADAAFSIIRLNPADLATQVRIDDALSQVPGVSLFRRTSSAAANPTTQGVSLRGIAGSGAGRALVSLDGVPQNDPFGGWVIWTGLPPESLDGASVVRGAGAGPYGAGALTGVIALDELSRPGAVNVDLDGGSLGSYRGSGATVQQVGGAELFASASAEHTDGWIPVRAGRGAADDALTLDDWSVATRLQAPIGRAQMALRVGAYREDRDAGLVGAGSTAQGESASLTIAAQPGPGEIGWRVQGWLHGSNLVNSSVSVAPGRVSTTPANTEYATPALGWGFNAAARGDAGNITWEAGGDVRGAAGEDRELFRNLGAGFTRNRLAGGRTLVFGGYGEASLTAGPWLFTANGRVDEWATLGGHRVETDRATGAVVFQDHPADRWGTVPSGRIGAKRELGEDLYVRASGYTGFRPPTLNELYRPFRVGNDITEANGALKPEKLYGAEAGFGGRTGDLTWSVTGFVSQLKDAITNVTIGVGPGVFPGFPDVGTVPAGGVLRQRQNAGAVNAEGVEAEAAFALASRLTLRAAADYTHATVDGGVMAPQLTGLRPAETPRFTATAGLDWRVAGPFSLHGDLRYESVRYDDDQNTRRLAPGVTVDARAEVGVTRGIAVYAAADNLFDADIQTGRTADGVVSYDAPRMFRVGVTFRR